MNFDITRDEVLNLAAEKLIASHEGRHATEDGGDEYSLSEGLMTRLDKMISGAVQRIMSDNYPKGVQAVIEAKLFDEIEKVMTTEYVPVNIWGDREGKPTSIRAALMDRARDYWDAKVDGSGKLAGYGGKPRHEHLFGTIVKEEFAKAIEQNVTNIVGALKIALRDDAVRSVTEHIDKIIKVKTN